MFDVDGLSLQVNEGKIPENRLALQMLAEEMLQWPNLEVSCSITFSNHISLDTVA